MVNKITNLTATGSWQVLTSTIIARGTRSVKLSATTAVAVQYRYAGQTAVWTIPANVVEVINGSFDPNEIEVLANNGVVIQIESSQSAAAFSGYPRV